MSTSDDLERLVWRAIDEAWEAELTSGLTRLGGMGELFAAPVVEAVLANLDAFNSVRAAADNPRAGLPLTTRWLP